jgi:hypothetical protein
MPRKKKHRKARDSTKPHPLFSGDGDYVASLRPVMPAVEPKPPKLPAWAYPYTSLDVSTCQHPRCETEITVVAGYGAGRPRLWCAEHGTPTRRRFGRGRRTGTPGPVSRPPETVCADKQTHNESHGGDDGKRSPAIGRHSDGRPDRAKP